MDTTSLEHGVNDHYHFLFNPWRKAIEINEHAVPDNPVEFFLTRPVYAPLLFPNVSSDARDHCANERTFLSWLRLSMYLAIVSAAIFINFHLKSQPTSLEHRISRPLGFIFWILALACLANGSANYMRTVTRYAHRRAIVQYGLKTQIIFGIIAGAIIAACGVFLSVEAQQKSDQQQ